MILAEVSPDGGFRGTSTFAGVRSVGLPRDRSLHTTVQQREVTMFNAHAGDDRMEQNATHEILKSDRRRAALEYMRQQLEPVSLRTLSEQVAAREAGESPPPRDLRKSVYVSLHQTHLPKLDDVGVVDYDKDRKQIALSERARDVDPYLDMITRFGVTWSTYYRTLGVVALLSIVVAEVGAVLGGGVEPLLVATVFLFAFTLSIGYQVWARRWFYLRALLSPD